MQKNRIYPTAKDDAHELGLVHQRMQELWDAFGCEVVERSDYGRLREHARVLACRVFRARAYRDAHRVT